MMWSGMDLGDGDLEMQTGPPDVSTEQLGEMFYKNMSLSDRLAKESSHQNTSVSLVEQTEEKPAPFKYSVSQHYTHTSHVVPALHPLQPSKQDIASRILIKNGISPSALLRSQLTLFEQADDDQRSRLIELWRIVPPTYARNGGRGLVDRLGEYPTTTGGQEGEPSWLRDTDREDASPTGDYPDRNQHCPAVMDRSSESVASGFGNPIQTPQDYQYDQIYYQPTINQDMHDEEML